MNTHSLVKNQIPDFIKSEYPNFVLFIEKYYEWLDSIFSNSIEDITSLLNTPESYEKYFYQYLDTYNIFKKPIIFDKKYIQYITHLYLAKGTIDSVKYLIKAIYGYDTQIVTPNDQVLIASNGKWEQFAFINVKKIFGTIPDNFTSFFIDYGLEEKEIEVLKYEIDGEYIRLYYNIHDNFIQENVVNVYIKERIYQDFGDPIINTLYTGIIEKTPSYFEIVNGGKGWQTGQVIILEGTTKNTISRVEKVDSEGTILALKIVEYGFGHSENEFLIISPYPAAPNQNDYEYSFSITSSDPISIHHELTINDQLLGIYDRSIGYFSGINRNSYFLENYTGGYGESPYNASIVFVNRSATPSYEQSDTIGITYNEWLESRAFLQLKYSDHAVLKGYYKDDNGQISNEFIRLQDNYYYQKYSYEISSEIYYDKYDNVVNYIHPSGLKRFNKYILEHFDSFNLYGYTNLPYKSINILDVLNSDDSLIKYITKPITDTIDGSDFAEVSGTAISKLLNKNLSDTYNIIEDLNKTVNRTLYDSKSTIDSVLFNKTYNRTVNETKTLSEIIEKIFSRSLDDNLNPISDEANASVGKSLNDTATTTAVDTTQVNTFAYDSENYSTGTYSELYIVLEVN